MARIVTELNHRDAELEHIMLYHLLTHPRRQEVMNRCYPSVFSYDDNRRIFEVIKELGENANIYTLALRLQEKGYGAKDNILMLFNEEVARYCESTEPESILDKLKQMLYRRAGLSRVERISNIIEYGTTTPDGEERGNLFDEVSKLIILENKLLHREKHTIEELARLTSERINTHGDTVSTGFPFVDTRMFGLTKRSISSLLAMPGHAKSMFSDAIMLSALSDSNEKGLIISLEDPVEERVKRIVANVLNISLSDMRFKRVKVPQEDILFVLKIKLGGRLTMIDTRDILTPEEASAAISDIKPSFFIVDHIQNFQMTEMVQGLIRAAWELETAAVRNNAHGMITSQVSDKKVMGREDNTPTAADAQWTSVLRQKSAEMFSLFYQYQISKNPLQQNLLKFEILKSRYSTALSSMYLKIDPDKGRIIEEAKNISTTMEL